MRGRDLAILVYTTVVAFATLYSPQPILPLLAREFGVDELHISLLTTATLLPLGLAPLFYGYVIEAIPARTLLRGAIALLALTQILYLIADSYWLFLGARLVQGLVLPAVLTSLMTYCSSMAPANAVRRVIGYYIAATIVGGFAGRALTGLIASVADWRLAFAADGLLLAVAWGMLFGLQRDARTRFARLRLDAAREFLRQAEFRNGFVVIFAVFFVFASLLNFLPFRLKALDPLLGEWVVGLVYSGYLVGIATALGAVPLQLRLGGPLRAVRIGLAVYLCGTLLFLSGELATIFAAMFVFCAGMFLVHAVLSGHLNHRAESRKGIVNGLYISSYYAGGALGSFLPGWVQRGFGWGGLIATLALVLVVALAVALRTPEPV